MHIVKDVEWCLIKCLHQLPQGCHWKEGGWDDYLLLYMSVYCFTCYHTCITLLPLSVLLFLCFREKNWFQILVPLLTGQMTLESHIISLSLIFLIYKVTVILSHRTVGRIKQDKICQVPSTEIMVTDQQMKTPPSFLSLHLLLMCLQGCKPVSILEPILNRRLKLLYKQIIHQLPKAKLKLFSL